MTKAEIIQWLRLLPNDHEGGFFASTYTSPLLLQDSQLPLFAATGNLRPLCSAIYYFLEPSNFSAMHRVKGDMIYHFYVGDPVQMLLLRGEEHGCREEVCVFSNQVAIGGLPMKIIPGGTWLGSRLIPGVEYALLGVTMSPGFHPVDYAIGKRDDLLEQFPDQQRLIEELTHPDQIL